MAQVIRDFVVVMPLPGADPRISSMASAPPAGGRWHVWTDGTLRVWWSVSGTGVASTPAPGESWSLLLGDPAEWDADAGARSLVNVVPIHYDATQHALTVHTAIVGLPPVFEYRGDGLLVVSSALHLMRELAGVRFEFDPAGVLDLGRTGHPVGHRTLFRNTRLLPGGHVVRVRPDDGVQITRSWQLPDARPAMWPEFIEAQVDAFKNAVRRIDVSESFLSLTAGLDTRTIFSELAAGGRLVPSVTMSGVRTSLDARTAARLCRAAGTRHDLVIFGDEFTRRLPEFAIEASRLSGGLESFDQAPEVYLYDQLHGEFSARISGNLGNQVGRGGTEGVGLRQASPALLAPAFVAAAGTEVSGHWLLDRLRGGARDVIEVILQEEIPFSSVANFSVGSHFARQQSPYADRTLVETLSMKPQAAHSSPSGSLSRMRLRDLHHRFLGEPAHASFQRTLLQRRGGIAAEYPINLGWRATGGVSPSGLLWGSATLLGLVVQKLGLEEGPFGGAVERTGLAALHNFRLPGRWLRRHLREFVHDTVTSQTLREAGILETSVLQSVLAEHYSGTRDHHETITFALDIALAHRAFCQAPGLRS